MTICRTLQATSKSFMKQSCLDSKQPTNDYSLPSMLPCRLVSPASLKKMALPLHLLVRTLKSIITTKVLQKLRLSNHIFRVVTCSSS